MNGTSAVMIFDEDDNIVRAVLKWTQFYEHESCGKCTPCREGNYWTAQILERIWDGHGRPELTWTPCSTSATTSSAGPSVRWVTARRKLRSSSSIKYFRDDYLALMNSGTVLAAQAALTGAST